jgi:hypothetical protein
MMHSGTLVSLVVVVVLAGAVRAAMWDVRLFEHWEGSVR